MEEMPQSRSVKLPALNQILMLLQFVRSPYVLVFNYSQAKEIGVLMVENITGI